jgi:hypothetical protein
MKTLWGISLHQTYPPKTGASHKAATNQEICRTPHAHQLFRWCFLMVACRGLIAIVMQVNEEGGSWKTLRENMICPHGLSRKSARERRIAKMRYQRTGLNLIKYHSSNPRICSMTRITIRAYRTFLCREGTLERRVYMWISASAGFEEGTVVNAS